MDSIRIPTNRHSHNRRGNHGSRLQAQTHHRGALRRALAPTFPAGAMLLIIPWRGWAPRILARRCSTGASRRFLFRKFRCAPIDGARAVSQLPGLCTSAPAASELAGDFETMDKRLTTSVDIAIAKAHTAAIFYVMTLQPGMVAAPGGIPLPVNGKVVGAIGVSGAPSGAMDSRAAQAGADSLK